MSLNLAPSIFGSPLRTRILVLTALLNETYPSELARLVKASPYSVGLAVDRLERERLVATRRWGNERRVTLNPTTAYGRELRALLLRLAETMPEYEESIRSMRKRPRRRGKPMEPADIEDTARARKLATR